MTQKKITITEREKRVIKWISNLSDKELFGLECFLAGIRMTANENHTGINSSQNGDECKGDSNKK